MKKKKAVLTADCNKCGEFKVVRQRKARPSTDGITVNDLPQSIVCPGCSMWAEVDMVEDIKSA